MSPSLLCILVSSICLRSIQHAQAREVETVMREREIKEKTCRANMVCSRYPTGTFKNEPAQRKRKINEGGPLEIEAPELTSVLGDDPSLH